ncbi:glycerophosphoryl diester phosphodiesterase [Hydrogenivirga caldilitoris]|uniref:Glycerophosphoryl diester phosphodiesterase n=1 Tax=Hydrogenivirga caldilitoris TaxID=246264 RepID=A0A497XNA0_9AQUI|nr:glycerophosphodiester phosphodiesterase [Hydrogenivirga caldilitoris]RLJ70338.1 glycerophosphoryl diester phosphodiesterase [Hydrogenivirga caldilitoris]
MLVLEKLSKRAAVGHRGIPALELENTLPSIRKAVDLGADIVEVDVQRTKDDVLILSHDENLKRTYGVDINVREALWEELKGIKKGDYGIARLEDAFDVVAGRAGMFVEIKHPEDTHHVFELIERKGVKDWVAVISFHLEVMEELKGKLITGLVYSKPPGMIPQAKKAGCSIVLPKYMLATQKAVDFAHRLKLFVVAWTVNDLAKARELWDRGVDGIATDDIRILKETLKA